MSLQKRFKKSTIATTLSKHLGEVHLEQHYTVTRYAKKWGLSDDFLRPIFKLDPGVLKIVRPEDLKNKKRAYVSLRIPESVAARVYERLHGKVA